MLDFLRRLKLTYMIYNFFRPALLRHNLPAYRKLGLRKRYFSPVSSADFTAFGAETAAQFLQPRELSQTKIYRQAQPETRASLEAFEENGFLVLPRYWSSKTVAAANAEVEELEKSGKARHRYVNKIMFAIHQSAYLRHLGEDPALLELLSSLFSGPAQLFQSINFKMGSEQHSHSDSIHMTTFPLGGLLGVWVALDDIDQDKGPLHYYPGSHRLPYYLNSEYQNQGTRFFLGGQDYTRYEEMIARKIAEQQLPKTTFCARAGDLLVWHANLLHGGNPHLNKAKTRRSMVLHYFRKNGVCYHEVTQRPALLKT